MTEAGVFASDFNNGRLEMAANFASSLFNCKWDPSFRRFMRGMMASPDTPARLRDNPELRKAYAPH